MFRIAQCFSVPTPTCLSLPPFSVFFLCLFFCPCQSSDSVFSSVSVALPFTARSPPLTFLHFGPGCGLWTLTRKLLPSAGHSPTQEVELIVQLLYLARPFMLILSLGPRPHVSVGGCDKEPYGLCNLVAQGVWLSLSRPQRPAHLTGLSRQDSFPSPTPERYLFSV